MYLRLFVFISFIYCNSVYSQLNINNTDSLDRYIKKHLSVFKLPGLVVGIIKDGKVYYKQAYGVKSNTDKSPVDIHTLFPIASITKTFTAVLVSSVTQEKNISINTPLRNLVPGFQLSFQPYNSEISVADVLSHRSGWKTFQGDLLNTESTLSDSQLVSKLNYLHPAFPLRTKFGYSNMGFLLAGMSVKGITGNGFDDELKMRILNPLQMNATFIDSVAIKAYANKTLLYSQTENGIVETKTKLESPRGYGGMYASINDLCTWMQVLLDSGRYQNKQVIPHNAITQSFNSYTIIGKQAAGNRKRYLKTYGLGWEIIQYEGAEIVQHGGAYAGSLSMLAMIPSLKFGVVILTNGDFHPLQETLKWQLIDALLGIAATDYSEAAFIRQQQRKAQSAAVNTSTVVSDTEKAMSPLFEQTIEGSYTCNAYGKAWIKKENNKYMLYLEHHPTVTGELNYKGDALFECRYSHAMFGSELFKFHVTEHGIAGFDLKVDSFVEDGVYLFHRD